MAARRKKKKTTRRRRPEPAPAVQVVEGDEGKTTPVRLVFDLGRDRGAFAADGMVENVLKEGQGAGGLVEVTALVRFHCRRTEFDALA